VTGAQVHVMHRSNTIAALAVGILGANDPRPVTVNTLFPCFSVTKGLMAALLHALLEKGAAKKYLSAPAADVSGEYQLPLTSFWPTFVRDGTSVGSIKAKQRITIEDVLTHRAGMQHAIPHDLTMTKFCSLWAMIEAMEVASPAHDPGTFTSYHYYTYGWLVAGIIHHLLGTSPTGGASIGKVLREVLLEPMGVADEIYLGVPLDVQDQLNSSGRLAVLGGNFADREGGSQAASTLASLIEAAGAVSLAEDDASRDMAALASLVQAMSSKMYLLDPRLFNRAAYRAAEIPAANAHCSARGLCTFYDKLGQMLEPTVGAPTLISKDRLLLAIQQRSSDKQELGLLPAERKAKFGLGFQLYPYVSDTSGIRPGWSNGGQEVNALPARTARLPAFGHNGFGGSVAFHDPNLQLSVAVTVNQLSGQQQVTRHLLAAIWDTVKSVP
jgi:CubicO group peptidase (beta-lactamase class C family)